MKTSDVIFWLGVCILIVSQASICCLRNKLTAKIILYFGLLNIVAIVLLITAWAMRKYAEKYLSDYRSAYVTGKVVAGTVYVDNPGNYPGLGWLP